MAKPRSSSAPSAKVRNTPPPLAQKPLSLLGRSELRVPTEVSAAILETFPNRHLQRDYVISFGVEDFTSLCPITRQPDFAEIQIDYVANLQCIETKSLKFYLASYRNCAAFNEEVANRILDDLVAACSPRRMTVSAKFASRGGIRLSVLAEHTSS